MIRPGRSMAVPMSPLKHCQPIYPRKYSPNCPLALVLVFLGHSMFFLQAKERDTSPAILRGEDSQKMGSEKQRRNVSTRELQPSLKMHLSGPPLGLRGWSGKAAAQIRKPSTRLPARSSVWATWSPKATMSLCSTDLNLAFELRACRRSVGGSRARTLGASHLGCSPQDLGSPVHGADLGILREGSRSQQQQRVWMKPACRSREILNL